MNDQQNNSVQFPLLNAPAPQFEAPSTHGSIKLEDYAGKWVVLFSHPADFTPVCTTEFVAFAKAAGAFENLNTQLVGLSIDSVFSHIAWVRDIEQKFDVKVPFPVIADLKMDVAAKYGMVHPGAADTSAVRAVFVIDPQQNLRAMVYYPLSNGRQVAEILRLVQALQTTDEHGVATPEAWQPGDEVIVPPPATQADAEARMTASYDVKDWYFSKRTV